jgi:hypothetical protein
MKLIERKVDVLTGSSNMEDVHSMSNFPVFMGCVEHSRDEDIVAEQTWQICKDNGFLQLKNLIPLNVLYQAQHAGAVGGIWKEHHRVFSFFLNKTKPLSVFEIGGAHGILSKIYQRLWNVPWTILEPNPTPVEDCEANFIKGFFDETFSYFEYFDTVVHSHIFEHIYDPDKFMQHLGKFIQVGKKLVFSIPNMQAMLERKYTNCINFEHTIFLTEVYVEYLLAKHGFGIISKEYFMDDHSIFYATVRDSTVLPISLPNDLYVKNKKLYNDYVSYHHSLTKILNNRIVGTSDPVYLFGAHIFSQYLIESGLETKNIVSLLDNDPAKQGKRLYGTNLMVQSPKVLRDVSNPIVILKAGVYNTEIKKDILENINSTATFLE